MATKKNVTVVGAVADPLANVRRVMSNVVLISQKELAKLSASETQALLLEESTLPKQVVEDFAKLSSRKLLKEKLLAGEDVSLELEFNNLEVTREQLAALAIVQPLLKAVDNLVPKYPWVNYDEVLDNIVLGSRAVSRAGEGYSLSIGKAKALWDKVAPYWAGVASTPPRGSYASYDGYNRSPEFGKDRIKIGCQTIARNELEFVARHYNWPLPEQKG